MTTRVSLRLPGRLAKSLRSVVARTDRTPAELMIRALEGYLGDLEDARIALARWKDDKDRVISHAAMKRRLGL